MTRDEAVIEILQELSYRRGGEAEVITQLQRSQLSLEQVGKTLPYFLRVVDQTLTLTVDQDYVLFPDDFIKEVEEAPIRYSDAAGNPSIRYLRKSDDKGLREYYTDSSSTVLRGGPSGYTFLVDRMRIFPTPDQAYGLIWDYYAHDVPLTSNIENKWLKYNPDILMGHAGHRLAKRKRSPEAAAVFQGMFADGQRQLISDNEERERTNSSRYLGRNA